MHNYVGGQYQVDVQKMLVVLQKNCSQSGEAYYCFAVLDIDRSFYLEKLLENKLMVLYLLPRVLMEKIVFLVMTRLYLGNIQMIFLQALVRFE